MWKKIEINHAPEWIEYQIELPNKECLRVWREDNGKWGMASLGRYISAPVDTKEEAQEKCEQFALKLLEDCISAIIPDKERGRCSCGNVISPKNKCEGCAGLI